MPTLFDPVRLGDLRLPHRVAMAPLTRNRAPGGVPVLLTAASCAQRTGRERAAALTAREASQTEPRGQGNPGPRDDTGFDFAALRAPVAEPDRETLHGGGAAGCTDGPALS